MLDIKCGTLMNNTAQSTNGSKVSLGENLRRGYPLIIDGDLVFDYRLSSDGVLSFSIHADQTQVRLKLNTHDALFKPSNGECVWMVGESKLHFTYSINHAATIFQHMLEKLEKNPSVLYFSDDPDHAAHLGFWFSMGSKFRIVDLEPMSHWSPPENARTLCTSQSGIVDSEDKQNALEIARNVIELAKIFSY